MQEENQKAKLTEEREGGRAFQREGPMVSEDLVWAIVQTEPANCCVKAGAEKTTPHTPELINMAPSTCRLAV